MLKDIGEFAFIKRFSSQFTNNLPQGVLGIGDDCAVIPYDDSHSLLLSTDTLVDSVHFISQKMNAIDLGYKCLAVNISDIAAMGGEPNYILLALSMPPTMDINWLDDFFTGCKQCCDEHQIHLIGGDTTKNPDKIVVTVTVIGKALTKNIKYRSSSQIGDVICVTGIIGDSVGGLHCYLNNLPETDDVITLKKAHLRPRPHIKEGLWLGKSDKIHSMIDVSDGIESDIKRIIESSQCGAEIDLSSLPLSKLFHSFARQQNLNPYTIAVSGGEDYCLLLTVDSIAFERISADFFTQFSFPLTAIGKIVSREQGLSFLMDNKKVNLTSSGYDHFLTQ